MNRFNPFWGWSATIWITLLFNHVYSHVLIGFLMEHIKLYKALLPTFSEPTLNLLNGKRRKSIFIQDLNNLELYTVFSKRKKHIVLSIFASIFFLICNGQNNFLIKGSLKNCVNNTVYLFANNRKLDSFLISDSIFVFKGKIDEPVFCRISIKGKSAYRSFILENDNYFIKGKADSIWRVKIDGPKNIQLEYEYGRLSKVFIENLNKSADLSRLYGEKKDTLMAKQYSNENYEWKQKLLQFTKNYILMHINEYFSILYFNRLDGLDREELRQVYNKFSDKLKKHSMGQKIQYKLFSVDSMTSIGAIAPNILNQDTSGKLISLNSISGKYILIDFWASWCAPCRKVHPEYKKIYYEYLPRGFQILSVSLDKSKKAWVDAIFKDELYWINVSDLKGFESASAISYGIEAIPMNYLLDSKGVIVAKDLKPDQLYTILSNLLTN